MSYRNKNRNRYWNSDIRAASAGARTVYLQKSVFDFFVHILAFSAAKNNTPVGRDANQDEHEYEGRDEGRRESDGQHLA